MTALYIHWPFCLSKCPYCDFNSHVRERVDENRWKLAMEAELRWVANHVTHTPVSSIFFGGGTPSLMPPKTVEGLIYQAQKQIGLAPDVEITLEANPTSVEAEKFLGFQAAGVNRVSLGVQALSADALAFLGRKHSADEALKTLELAARIFPRYSFDLIYARPGQTVAAWEAELQQALGFARGHMSLYQLTIEEGTAFFPAYARGDFTIPDDDTAAQLYERTCHIMEHAGMPAYEISNYAAPGHASRHNLAYWRGEDYIGIGPGAHGRVHHQGARLATQAIKSPERWLEAVEREGHGFERWEALPESELRMEALMMRLRLVEALPRALFPWLKEHTLQRLAEEGLLTFDAQGFQTTLKGRLLLNYVTGALAE